MTGLATSSPTPKRMPRVHARRTFSGAIRVDGTRALIRPAPGAYRRKTDADGEVISDTYEPHASLPTNIGDRVIVCGPTIEETAILIVQSITRDGALYGTFTHGAIAETTTKVHLLPVKLGAAAKQLGLFGKKRRAA